MKATLYIPTIVLCKVYSFVRYTNLKRGTMGVCEVQVLLLLATICGVYTQEHYTICATLKDKGDCEQIGRSDRLRCKYSDHQTDCLLNIEQGKVDFGRVTPEVALTGAKFLKNVTVLGEFRTSAMADDSEFAIGVLVRKDLNGGLRDMRNKNYCHPGFKFDHFASGSILKEFENAALKANQAEGCRYSVKTNTLAEKEIKALSDFFGPSCRPGPWIGFEKYDNDLYTNYKKLCTLCTNNDKCQPGNEPFKDSINCLVNGGDVAVTTISTIYQYFNSTENKNKTDEFRYLCKNGDINLLDNPCPWSKQPWNLIVVNKNRESALKKDIQSWFSSSIINKDPGVESTTEKINIESLQAVLFPEEKVNSKIYMVEGGLKDYIEKYREIPSTDEKCGENVRWCTVSIAEQQKCEWLAQASANLALQPTIKCSRSPNMFACLEDIKVGKVDVVASDAHFGYIARKKNLAPLAYPDTAEKYRIKPIIVIKSSDNSITSLKDLKDKKACFPEYGGIEWLSFINTARESNAMSHASCDYGHLISNFVSEACMPGARDREHEISQNIDKEKLCKLCQPDPNEQSKTAENCNSNAENRFYGNSGALLCLKEVGDFAVVTQEDYPSFNSNEFKVLCKNGSVALATGFNVDENCALTKIIDSEVIAKKATSKLDNINVVLLNLETRFGLDRHKSFEVFNVFNNTLDLLFKDSTQGLTYLNSDSEHIKNFVKLFTDVEKCEKDDKNSATSLAATAMPFMICLLLLLGF